jgi:hypothetical protein
MGKAERREVLADDTREVGPARPREHHICESYIWQAGKGNLTMSADAGA